MYAHVYVLHALYVYKFTQLYTQPVSSDSVASRLGEPGGHQSTRGKIHVSQDGGLYLTKWSLFSIFKTDAFFVKMFKLHPNPPSHELMRFGLLSQNTDVTQRHLIQITCEMFKFRALPIYNRTSTL